MSFSTPDLFDENRDSVQVSGAGLQHFGGVRHFTGQAVIVNCPQDNSAAVEALKHNGDGKVLIIQGNGTLEFAMLGDIMAEKAIHNHWQGVIVNACVRDVEILRTMPLGVMALGVTPRSTIKKGVGSPLQHTAFLNMQIHQDNWIYADENGVVVSASPLL
jgi:regulator of ribonuclease activity A